MKKAFVSAGLLLTVALLLGVVVAPPASATPAPDACVGQGVGNPEYGAGAGVCAGITADGGFSAWVCGSGNAYHSGEAVTAEAFACTSLYPGESYTVVCYSDGFWIYCVDRTIPLSL